jgi:hypothetical protein
MPYALSNIPLTQEFLFLQYQTGTLTQNYAHTSPIMLAIQHSFCQEGLENLLGTLWKSALSSIVFVIVIMEAWSIGILILERGLSFVDFAVTSSFANSPC